MCVFVNIEQSPLCANSAVHVHTHVLHVGTGCMNASNMVELFYAMFQKMKLFEHIEILAPKYSFEITKLKFSYNEKRC